MPKINTFENVNITDMMESLKVLADILAEHPPLDIAIKQANILASSSVIKETFGITSQLNDIFHGNEQGIKSCLKTLAFQTELLRNTQNFYLTDSLSSFRNYLLQNDYFSAIEAIKSSVQRSTIEAPNIAFISLNKSLKNIIDADFPRGLRASIDGLHTKTAQWLSTSESISYSCEKSTFFVEDSPADNCKARELNVIHSGARLFAEITEEELIAFLCYLSTYMSLGSEHDVGRKIMSLVKNIDRVISFDAEYFYHARTLDDDLCPYAIEDMTCAPHGIPSFGRFNHIGNNYFYFSDQQSGAVEEVRKHSPKNKFQVAKLKPKGKIRLVDISQDEENIFLKYCRFPLDPHSNKKVPREYLIPAYFSDCCKFQGFDGIKYYGTKAYRNYVTWKDGHFDFVSQEIVHNRKTEKTEVV